MIIHPINLILNIIFGSLVAYRIHRGGIFESGTMLRLGIFLFAIWRGFGDIHEITGWFDWAEGLHYSPIRDAISETILLSAVALDLARDFRRRRSALKVKGLVEEVKKQNEKVESVER